MLSPRSRNDSRTGTELNSPEIDVDNNHDPSDGYDYNDVDDVPRQHTKVALSSPPIELQSTLLDLTITEKHEDQDIAFTESLPHIYQRQRDSWNAKLPNLESTIDGVSGSNESNGNQGKAQTVPNSSQNIVKQHRLIRIMPRWFTPQGRKRSLQLEVEKAHVANQTLESKKHILWQ